LAMSIFTPPSASSVASTTPSLGGGRLEATLLFGLLRGLLPWLLRLPRAPLSLPSAAAAAARAACALSALSCAARMDASSSGVGRMLRSCGRSSGCARGWARGGGG
jgi:hypothetical protein